MKDIPEDPKEFEAWLYARFAEKDKMLLDFYETGEFKHAKKSVETAIGLRHFSEIADIWTPLAVVVLLLNITTKTSDLWSKFIAV